MNASRWISMCLIVGPLALAACNRRPWVEANDTDEALKSLGSTVPAPEYGRDFWQRQHDQNSNAWQQAAKVCSESILQNYPNCMSVNEIIQMDVGKQAEAERKKNGHSDEMTERGFEYDAVRGLWFRETDMITLRCIYTRLSPNSLADFRATFQCPPGTKLPDGEK
jgi:hypothetical protein